jgi:hypothetical protein
MQPTTIKSKRTKRLFGWIGTICLLLIIPIKAIRWVNLSTTVNIFIGIAPSILGPVGLLFLILSSSSPRLARLTLFQTTLITGAIALSLEFIQLIPRPGILERVHYTFDWLDIAATLLSISVGFVVARFISNNN